MTDQCGMCGPFTLNLWLQGRFFMTVTDLLTVFRPSWSTMNNRRVFMSFLESSTYWSSKSVKGMRSTEINRYHILNFYFGWSILTNWVRNSDSVIVHFDFDLDARHPCTVPQLAPLFVQFNLLVRSQNDNLKTSLKGIMFYHFWNLETIKMWRGWVMGIGYVVVLNILAFYRSIGQIWEQHYV